MKNFFKFFTITLLAITVSCSSDDDSSSENNSVSGSTFLLTAFETESSLDIDGDGDSSTNLLVETGCLQNNRLVFSTNGTVTAINDSFLDIFVDEDANGDIVQIVECTPTNDTETLPFSENGNSVSIDDEDEAITGTLSGDQLVFILNNGFVGEFLNEDGSDGTFELEETITITYSRQ